MEDGRCLIDVISDPDALNDFFLPDDNAKQVLLSDGQQLTRHTHHLQMAPPSLHHSSLPPSPMTGRVGSPMVSQGSPLVPQATVSPLPQCLSPAQIIQQPLTNSNIRSTPSMVFINHKLVQQPQILPKPVLNNTVAPQHQSIQTSTNLYNPGQLAANTAIRLPNGHIINLNQATGSSGTVTVQPTGGGSPINIQGTLIQTAGGKYLIQNPSAGQLQSHMATNTIATTQNTLLNNGAIAHFQNGPQMGMNINPSQNLNVLTHSNQQIFIQGAPANPQGQNVILRTIPSSNIQMMPSGGKTVIFGQQNVLQQQQVAAQFNTQQQGRNINATLPQKPVLQNGSALIGHNISVQPSQQRQSVNASVSNQFVLNGPGLSSNCGSTLYQKQPLQTSISTSSNVIQSSNVQNVSNQNGANSLNTQIASLGIANHASIANSSTQDGLFPSGFLDSSLNLSSSIGNSIVQNPPIVASSPTSGGHSSQPQTVQLSSQAQIALQKINMQMKQLLGLDNPTIQQKNLLHQLGEVQRKILDHGRQMALKTFHHQQHDQKQAAAQAVADEVQVMAQRQANQAQMDSSPSTMLVSSSHVTVSTQQSSNQLGNQFQQQLSNVQPVTLCMPASGQKSTIQKVNLNAMNVPNVTVTKSDLKLSSLKPIFMKTSTPTMAAAPINSNLVHSVKPTPSMGSSSMAGKVQHQLKFGNQIFNLNLTVEQKLKLESHMNSLTPAQREEFIKNQKVILTKLQQQKALQQQQQQQSQIIRISKPTQPSKIGSGGNLIGAVAQASMKDINPSISGVGAGQVTNVVESLGGKRTMPGHFTKQGMIGQQIWRDQGKVVHPDCKNPFRNLKDAMSRLLSYHVYYVKEPSSNVLKTADDNFEEYAQSLLDKARQLKERFRQLLLAEGLRSAPTSELYMMEKTFLSSEKHNLADERRLAATNPDEFVASPLLKKETATTPPLPPPPPLSMFDIPAPTSYKTITADSKTSFKAVRLKTGDDSRLKMNVIKIKRQREHIPSDSISLGHVPPPAKVVKCEPFTINDAESRSNLTSDIKSHSPVGGVRLLSNSSRNDSLYSGVVSRQGGRLHSVNNPIESSGAYSYNRDEVRDTKTLTTRLPRQHSSADLESSVQEAHDSIASLAGLLDSSSSTDDDDASSTCGESSQVESLKASDVKHELVDADAAVDAAVGDNAQQCETDTAIEGLLSTSPGPGPQSSFKSEYKPDSNCYEMESYCGYRQNIGVSNKSTTSVRPEYADDLDHLPVDHISDNLDESIFGCSEQNDLVRYQEMEGHLSSADTPPSLVSSFDVKDTFHVSDVHNGAYFDELNFESFNEQMQSAIDSILSLQQGDLPVRLPSLQQGDMHVRLPSLQQGNLPVRLPSLQQGNLPVRLPSSSSVHASVDASIAMEYEDISGEEDNTHFVQDETSAAIQSIL